jgi:hypothetical protein
VWGPGAPRAATQSSPHLLRCSVTANTSPTSLFSWYVCPSGGVRAAESSRAVAEEPGKSWCEGQKSNSNRLKPYTQKQTQGLMFFKKVGLAFRHGLI